jgi:hypothetical protein
LGDFSKPVLALGNVIRYIFVEVMPAELWIFLGILNIKLERAIPHQGVSPLPPVSLSFRLLRVTVVCLSWAEAFTFMVANALHIT